MANVARCPQGADPGVWKQYRAMSATSKAIFCHGNFDEYVRLRRAGQTLGISKSSDIVRALVDLYHQDYADRIVED